MSEMQLQNALSKPLPQRCKEIDDIVRNSSHKDLHNVLPGLLENIFGFGSEPGWGLDSLTKTQHHSDVDAILRLLGPEGPILSLIYNLQTDPYLAFEFPFSCLPGPTRRMIEDGSLPMFYVNKIQYNQTYNKPALALSAFEFYMFHFCYTLVNPQWQSRPHNWNNIADIVYPCLLEEYLQYYLPLNKRDLPKFPHAQTSPVRNSMVQQTPNISGKHSPGSGNQPRTRSRLGLLKANLMSTQKSHNQSSPGGEKAEAEIWWSDTFIQILAEFWFNQNSLDNEKGITPQTLDTFNPSNNHIRLVRLLIKHVHYFVNSAAPEVITSPYQTPDTSPLDEFKRSLIPQVMQKKVYAFLRHSFDRWPLDSSFKLVLETWLTYIQPWRYLNIRPKSRSVTDVDEVPDSWFPFIRDNFLFYTTLLQDFLLRAKRMHLTAVHNAYMLFRVSKVFSLPNLPQLLREVEKMMFSAMFKTSREDLGASYIVPEVSMVLKVQISELERPDFNYINLFGTETQVQVRHVLQQISDAQFAIEAAQPEKKAAKSGFASFFDFSTMFEDSRQAYGDLSGSEVKKLVTHLDQAILNLCFTFNLSKPVRQQLETTSSGSPSRYAGDQSVINQTFTISPTATPDCVHTEHGVQLTPLGRYQVMNGLRKFEIGYQGDPDLQPIRSFENKTLVRILYRISDFINKQFNQTIQSLYNRQDIIGRMSHVYFAPPLSPSKLPQAPVSQDMYKHLQKPRVSLRFLASYQTLLYLGIVYALLWLGWGVGSLGYLLFLGACVLAYACFRALTETQEFNVN